MRTGKPFLQVYIPPPHPHRTKLHSESSGGHQMKDGRGKTRQDEGQAVRESQTLSNLTREA